MPSLEMNLSAIFQIIHDLYYNDSGNNFKINHGLFVNDRVKYLTR